jgi:hypothetical protein
MRWHRLILSLAALLVPPLSGQAPGSSPVREPTSAAEGSLPGRAAPPEEDDTYRGAVESAFAYLKEHRAPRTGLVQATPGWAHITLWDMGSLLGAVYGAGELGMLTAAERDAWLGELLATLGRVPLFDRAAYNRVYVAATGRMVDGKDRPSDVGSGWSSTDLGRLLIWLKVIETRSPAHAEAARAAAQRIDFKRVVRDGYLHGADIKNGKRIEYDEGKVGYEQYAARGFALWGHVADRAIDPKTHAEPIQVMGQTLLHDKRGGDKLTSEPFILMGMELGYDPEFEALSRAMLAVQEARYRDTGTITMVSEDAIEVPPWYFYYYSVYSEGEQFAVRAHGPVKNGPRWVSAKAAFAWHALFPSDYTWKAVQSVAPARSSSGWASGVFERSQRSTGVRNLNTAAVIIEAALYRKLGRPLLGA